MRHTGFPRVDGLSTDPRDLGRHNNFVKFSSNLVYLCEAIKVRISFSLLFILCSYFLILFRGKRG